MYAGAQLLCLDIYQRSRVPTEPSVDGMSNDPKIFQVLRVRPFELVKSSERQSAATPRPALLLRFFIPKSAPSPEQLHKL